MKERSRQQVKNMILNLSPFRQLVEDCKYSPATGAILPSEGFLEVSTEPLSLNNGLSSTGLLELLGVLLLQLR